MAIKCVLDHIYATHHHQISHWNADILNPVALQVYADTIHHIEAPLQNCFGFIVGTVRSIARQGTNQPILYNGYKRVQLEISSDSYTERPHCSPLWSRKYVFILKG